MTRVIAYVDAFNLYFGLRESRWKDLYWLDVHQLAAQLLKPDQRLLATKYFTSVVRQPPDKHKRQNTYLEALATIKGLSLYYGKYLSELIRCRYCGNEYTTFHEKMTDVNIAVEMLSDAYAGAFDTALLVSADSDLAGLVRKVTCVSDHKRVVVAFPPNRHSRELQAAASGHTFIDRSALLRCQLPEMVRKADGYTLRRPIEWR